ncbi:hypothetical protein C2G38_2194065 [Gigaspora rosea]|uniref:TLDc domain-containing protein n=1 Tax=Gigaspora rosea TaxID=44941 RepID=A0A397UX84_9GLOM|nr:hypothetical protein C2G38_2194065 [Gigaspora rosea]
MSGKDIVAKVKPYRQFLGLNLWDDISIKIMDPEASISSLSYLLVKKFPSNFLGTRDGFTYKIFHRLCDNIPGTVVVIKINGTNEILDGYNPLSWISNDQFKWFATTDIIGCANFRGPFFGKYFYTRYDIKQWNYVHNDADYEKLLRSDEISLLIDEFKVFQVLKN